MKKNKNFIRNVSFLLLNIVLSISIFHIYASRLKRTNKATYSSNSLQNISHANNFSNPSYKLVDNKIQIDKKVTVEHIEPLKSSPSGKAHVDFTHAANLGTKSVVHIKCYGIIEDNKAYIKHPLEELFKEFFGDKFFEYYKDKEQEIPKKKKQQLLSIGSGVIISEDGYIITNNHVVANPNHIIIDKIEVALDDKTPYEAEIVKTDPITDLAVLKIIIDKNPHKKDTKFPYLKFGNSDNLAVGEWVLAVGNPFDLASTVTEGIVSAKARGIKDFGIPNEKGRPIHSFIQTSAAVNRGNSGGALVNLAGELVGVVTAIITGTSQTFIGYAFAIPSSIVQKVANDIIQYKVVKRAFMGVAIADLDDPSLRDKKLNIFNGAYVVSHPNLGSPANKAGIKQDDIIVGINNYKIKNTHELQEKIAQYNPGDKIQVRILRKNILKTIELVLGTTSTSPTIVYTNQNKELEIGGAVFENTSKKIQETLNLKDGGVRVKKIKNGKFKEAGFVEGLIITKINNIGIHNIQHLGKIFNNLQPGEGVLVEGINIHKEKKVHLALTWGEA